MYISDHMYSCTPAHFWKHSANHMAVLQSIQPCRYRLIASVNAHIKQNGKNAILVTSTVTWLVLEELLILDWTLINNSLQSLHKNNNHWVAVLWTEMYCWWKRMTRWVRAIRKATVTKITSLYLWGEQKCISDLKLEMDVLQQQKKK